MTVETWTLVGIVFAVELVVLYGAYRFGPERARRLVHVDVDAIVANKIRPMLQAELQLVTHAAEERIRVGRGEIQAQIQHERDALYKQLDAERAAVKLALDQERAQLDAAKSDAARMMKSAATSSRNGKQADEDGRRVETDIALLSEYGEFWERVKAMLPDTAQKLLNYGPESVRVIAPLIKRMATGDHAGGGMRRTEAPF